MPRACLALSRLQSRPVANSLLWYSSHSKSSWSKSKAKSKPSASEPESKPKLSTSKNLLHIHLRSLEESAVEDWSLDYTAKYITDSTPSYRQQHHTSEQQGIQYHTTHMLSYLGEVMRPFDKELVDLKGDRSMSKGTTRCEGMILLPWMQVAC